MSPDGAPTATTPTSANVTSVARTTTWRVRTTTGRCARTASVAAMAKVRCESCGETFEEDDWADRQRHARDHDGVPTWTYLTVNDG